MLHPVIMAGGAGTRFWPRSRQCRPKQLIEIVGQGTMIQQTVARLCSELPAESILIVTNQAQAAPMREQLPQLAPEQIVAEPCGRDTSACIGLAAFMLRKADPDAVMAVCSADHIISPAEELIRCTKEAARLAAEHRALVTFGIKPSHPSELYGYIRRGEPLGDATRDSLKAFKLLQFKEKPDRKTAEEFLASGEYYWNSGNFVWRVDDIIQAIRAFLPELYAGLDRIEPALGAPEQADALAREYPARPKVSIDYGVMEKAPNAVVVEATFEWDEGGSWDSVTRHHPSDDCGNIVLAEHVGMDTAGCILASEEGHLLTTIGVRDLIVVHTADATLVCDRRRAADVKALVERLKERGLEAHL